ncbi:MAG: AI-2E family transporter [Flavobacteriales bacterium]|nr:AI-2E family transporter [Flavobacteriales bacterium]
MSVNRIASSLIICIAVVIILIYGSSLLIPFVFAWCIWFLVREIKHLLNRIPWINDKVPNWINNLLASIVIFAALGMIGRVLSVNIQSLARSYPQYESNIHHVTDGLNKQFNIDIMRYVNQYAGDLDFGAILSSIFNSISDMLGNAVMILIYVIFIFIEEAFFLPKLKALFSDEKQYDKIYSILVKISDSISHYIGLKTLISIITGTASYIALFIIGIQAPFFWAFLIFLLNYIPTIGSLTATVFPAVFALLQYGEVGPFVYVLVCVGAIQVIMGNIIEPKMMGNSLNISALVTLLSLSFWGALWGVTGMMLSVPITVMMVIIFSHFPATRPIAILLSDKGKV